MSDFVEMKATPDFSALDANHIPQLWQPKTSLDMAKCIMGDKITHPKLLD